MRTGLGHRSRPHPRVVAMRAIVHDPTTGLRMSEVPEPEPAPDQVLIDVRAASLNFLDVAYRDLNLPAGAVPGVDAAGIVRTTAADGSGPPSGSRVVPPTLTIPGSAVRRASSWS